MKHVVKVILLLLNLLWGLLLVIGSYSAYFPSRIGTLVELLFPLNLFACIAFFFIWLAYNPRYIWVPLAALVISWGGIARYCPVHKPQPIDNSQPGFSLMTTSSSIMKEQIPGKTGLFPLSSRKTPISFACRKVRV